MSMKAADIEDPFMLIERIEYRDRRMHEIRPASAEDRTKNPLRPQSFDEIVGQEKGMLPDAFVNRFPLRPRLVPYTLTASPKTG